MPRIIIKDKLTVRIYDTRAEMGRAAGEAAAARLRVLLKEKNEVNVIFAAAPSQNEMLATLADAQGIDWTRVNAFHMDEYLGLDPAAPQNFGNFLRRAIFDKVPFKNVFYIASEGNEETVIDRYTALLEQYPADMVCLGIGENGHIAFNDPWVADFEDPLTVKRVGLDEVCRRQQVNDGCFDKLEDVPHEALTLTIPALMRAGWLFCTVPAQTKAEAVFRTLTEPITADIPAAIMRRHDHAFLYCDRDSGAKLL